MTLYRPTTLLVMEEILQANLDTLRQIECDIAELEHDLETAGNDWAADSATLKLTAAREQQRLQIEQAGRNLRTVEALRKRGGMGPSVLARIYGEYAK